MKKFIIFFGVIFLFSCKGQRINNKIQGVWIFDKKINNLYLNDTSGVLSCQEPILYDFKKNGKLIVKNYGYKDTIFNWFIKSDSILTIDSLEYTIHSLNQNSIILIDYNAADTFWLIFKRPKQVKLKYNKNEIENILLSNIWSINDSLNQEWATHFEYFDNKTMIYRYKLFEKNFNDTSDNLQLETWGIAKYKDYYFLYSYIDMRHGNGNINRINQIIDINPNSYTILDLNSKNKKVGFHSIMKGSNNQKELKEIKGNWMSYNSKNRTYGKYIPKRAIEQGWIALFNGYLNMSIQKKFLTLRIDTLEPLKYTWQLSKDGRTLVLEYHINEPKKRGIHVEYADILELSEYKMKIRLFDNNFYTGLEKPNRYILNLIQIFEKVE